MKSRRLFFLSVSFLTCFSAIIVSTGYAQWHSDSTTNTIVCDTIGQRDNPKICSDGANGAIITWEDNRDPRYSAIYAQRLDANGHAMWRHNGIVLNTVHASAQQPIIASDDSGGAYVVWEDSRYISSRLFGLCLFGQHIKADGTLAYPDTALPVGIGKNDRQNPVICDDGYGAAYVVWEDYRSSIRPLQSDIYMNRLGPSEVKFGLTSGNSGVVRMSAQHSLVFNDPNADFNASLIGLKIIIAQKEAYVITAVPNDTTLILSPTPREGSDLSYVIEGPVGLSVDTMKNQQVQPAICDDGASGCYIAWESRASTPSSIYVTRIDSTGLPHGQWNSNPGVLVSDAFPVTSAYCHHVTIRRDGSQLMLAWEIYDGSYDTTDIMAERMNSDSTKVWNSEINVTGVWPFAQYSPQIFSDDSAFTPSAQVSPMNGILVLFQTDHPVTGTDIAMVRVLPDLNPKPASGFYTVCNQPNAQNGFQAVKINSGSLLVAWNDARNGDTGIYAQRVDRSLTRYFPVIGSTWGLPVSVDTSNIYNKTQVVLAPRTFGAIAAWTDYRNGPTNPGIYAQWIFRDSVLPIELESFNAICHHRGAVDLTWKTANEHSCAGFEIERRRIDTVNDNQYEHIASFTDNSALRGSGTSNFEHNYAFTDRNIEPAIYEYRLVDISLDGSRTAHEPKRVDASYGENVDGWRIGPNQPNPFIDRTTLSIALPTDAIVDLTISDVTGRTLATPVLREYLSAGVYQIALSAKAFGAASGNYMARMNAYDPVTGAMLWHSVAPVMMIIVR